MMVWKVLHVHASSKWRNAVGAALLGCPAKGKGSRGETAAAGAESSAEVKGEGAEKGEMKAVVLSGLMEGADGFAKVWPLMMVEAACAAEQLS